MQVVYKQVEKLDGYNGRNQAPELVALVSLPTLVARSGYVNSSQLFLRDVKSEESIEFGQLQL